jgi:hypothetical protein
MSEESFLKRNYWTKVRIVWFSIFVISSTIHFYLFQSANKDIILISQILYIPIIITFFSFLLDWKPNYHHSKGLRT